MSDIENSLFRVQLADKNVDPYYNRHAPIKRVSISADGGIEFNPDERKYIYFSKSMKHHSYYLYNKVVQIINDELKYAKGRPQFSKIDLPENMAKFLPSKFASLKYYNMNSEIIKKVQAFFRDYLPPKDVELVSLQYLNTFGTLLDNCAIKNSKKNQSLGPEVSDQRMYGGAYGINDVWLDLLKSSTVITNTTIVKMDKFFDFLLDESFFGEAGRARLNALSQEQELIGSFSSLKYNDVANPKIYDKNNINDIVSIVDQIKDCHLYNPKIELSKEYFSEIKSSFKNELRNEREK